MQLRIDGLSYTEIATELKVVVKTAWQYVNDALAEVQIETAEKTEHLRTLELARLDVRRFGKVPDASLSTFKLAEMATGIDAAALLTYRAAWQRDQGRNVTKEAAMAKMTATENAQQVIDAAVQIWGGMGVVSGHIVERLYREIRSLRIYEGATEVQQLIIARDLLKEVSSGSRHA